MAFKEGLAHFDGSVVCTGVDNDSSWALSFMWHFLAVASDRIHSHRAKNVVTLRTRLELERPIKFPSNSASACRIKLGPHLGFRAPA
jgi:hypothetical protein